MADHALGKPCPRCGTLTACSGAYVDENLSGQCACCGGAVSTPNTKYSAPLIPPGMKLVPVEAAIVGPGMKIVPEDAIVLQPDKNPQTTAAGPFATNAPAEPLTFDAAEPIE